MPQHSDARAAEHSACRMFLFVSSVLALAIFEAFFYFGYVAPRVEMQSVKDSAHTVVRYLARDTDASATPAERRAACKMFAAAEALPEEPPPVVQRAQDAARGDNVGCFATTAVVLVIFALLVAVVWRQKIKGKYAMPRDALLDEVAILLVAFAAFDLLFFGALVRHWEATDGPEFLAAMNVGVQDACAPA